MTEKLDIQAALRDAVNTEKEAMDFYRFAAEKSTDEKAREVFELLAREERQHALMFYNACKGPNLPSFEEMMVAPPNTESSWWKVLQQILLGVFDERKALELSIEQEEILEKNLREMAERIDEPSVRAIYLANANSTHHHCELIEEQYRDYLGMA
jgi:rubrerythrin